MAVAAAFALACQASYPAFASDQPVAASADARQLQRALDALVQRARPGVLGVAVLDLQSGASAGVHADQAFPMMSVFKAPVAAAVLARVDGGSLSLDQPVVIHQADVLSGSAVPSIGAHFHGEQMTFTVGQLLTAAVSQSDNTAVDALIKVVGGPEVVTAFLRAHGIAGMRVDQGEAGVSRVAQDLRPGESEPVDESAQAARARHLRGYQAFLADPRNRSTPEAAVTFLHKLWKGELLSPASTQRLLNLMYAQTIPNRLRAGLPANVRLADKSGTSWTVDGRIAAYNDIGILSWPDGHVVIVAAFLSDSPATPAARDALFAGLARDIAAAARR
ncbi:serine hydrolase [Dyella solisilvae]|uniref:Beta-lactamase n=2 Tax=Dyella solisilvae TaxID=1920168 RepID=A0A370K6F0_9GAMM|nr:serine hydrolase [Dyella solisilvae]